MFYSPSTGFFYISAIHGSQMPPDVTEITNAMHAELMDGQSAGKKIVCDKKAGLPILVDPPIYVPTADGHRAERDRLIESVRWRIERHSDELAMGSEPIEPLEPLLQYVQALRDVPQQSGFPESVEWPECP